MTIEVKNDETHLCIRNAANVQFKVTNLLQEYLEAQDASDESSDMNESEPSNKPFDFFTKQAITLAETVLHRILNVSSIKSLKYKKLVYLLSNFRFKHFTLIRLMIDQNLRN